LSTTDPTWQRDDGGLPYNALDKLRQVAMLRREGVSDDEIMVITLPQPAAYDFASRLIMALTDAGPFDDAVGPLPPEQIDGQ